MTRGPVRRCDHILTCPMKISAEALKAAFLLFKSSVHSQHVSAASDDGIKVC